MIKKSIKQSVFFLLIITLMISCKNENSREQFKVLNYIKTSKNDSSFFLKNKLLSNTKRSIDAQHYMFSEYKGKYITTFLNQSGDSVMVYNGINLLRVKIPFMFKVPISSLYFHNYDSIFVFLDREFVSTFSTDTFHIDDFILINFKGELVDRYSLDGLPNIYNGQLNPMIYLKKSFVKNKRIRNNRFYLPFSIYMPRISDYKLKDLKLSLLCEYDLQMHLFRPLRISIPDDDIGIHYSENVAANSIDFFVLNDSSIIFTYDYSPVVYGYNLLKDSIYVVYLTNDFPFHNDTLNNSKLSVVFNCPVFNKENNYFIRGINVNNYKNYENFEISQFFDSSFNSLGFSFSNSIWSSLNANSQGKLIVSDKGNRYLSYLVKLGRVSLMSFNEIESGFLVRNELAGQSNKKKHIENMFENKYEDRLNKYINTLKFENVQKYVLINTDILCSHCIEFLMNKLNSKNELLRNNKVKYVFYGNNLRFAEDLMNQYQISSFDLIYIDSKCEYFNYLKPEEYSRNPLIVRRGTVLKVFLYEPNNLKEVYSEFIDY